jgi:hypothetical protein
MTHVTYASPINISNAATIYGQFHTHELSLIVNGWILTGVSWDGYPSNLKVQKGLNTTEAFLTSENNILANESKPLVAGKALCYGNLKNTPSVYTHVIAGSSHTKKNIRNCFYYSRVDGTRMLKFWNEEENRWVLVKWDYFKDLYERYCKECGFRDPQPGVTLKVFTAPFSSRDIMNCRWAFIFFSRKYDRLKQAIIQWILSGYGDENYVLQPIDHEMISELNACRKYIQAVKESISIMNAENRELNAATGGKEKYRHRLNYKNTTEINDLLHLGRLTDQEARRMSSSTEEGLSLNYNFLTYQTHYMVRSMTYGFASFINYYTKVYLPGLTIDLRGLSDDQIEELFKILKHMSPNGHTASNMLTALKRYSTKCVLAAEAWESNNYEYVKERNGNKKRKLVQCNITSKKGNTLSQYANGDNNDVEESVYQTIPASSSASSSSSSSIPAITFTSSAFASTSLVSELPSSVTLSSSSTSSSTGISVNSTVRTFGKTNTPIDYKKMQFSSGDTTRAHYTAFLYHNQDLTDINFESLSKK